MQREWIEIRGAREHNLKNIDLMIPRDKLVVITGLSGSGKSSLAFDTIYAEGQRRYVESLSAYARQFLEQMDKPDVDSIEGLSPAISIEQKTGSRNPRSTVATVTEIYDYLRLLFARVGKPFCYRCGKAITSQTVTQIVDHVLALPEKTRIQILAPVVRGRKGEYRKEFFRMRKEGFIRVQVDGKMYELSEEINLDKNKKHNIEIVIDRIAIKPEISRRLADSIELALRHSEGIVVVEIIGGERLLFSERLACIDCGVSYPDVEPSLFSFNSPHGACPSCGGIGTLMRLDPDLIVPDKNLSLREGALRPWNKRNSFYFHQMILSLARHYGFDVNTPFKDLPERVRHAILYGSGDEEISFHLEGKGGLYTYKRPFEGLLNSFDRRYRETDSAYVREDIEDYMGVNRCPDCNGARLKKESLSFKVGGRNIAEVTGMSIREAGEFFRMLLLDEKEARIAERILKEIRERLGFLISVGLPYLTLDRTAATLSGGEGQRIRLATQIGSSLVGVLYILDEPSIGLHQRDNKRLLATLKRLRDIGNTILVVEHDEETILNSDHVIDMGPGAGEYGGEIVAQGTPDEIKQNPHSLTGKYLSRELGIPVPQTRRKPRRGYITVVQASENNLKGVDVRFPIGLLTCVTGVSGSGKSTLVLDILYRALAQRLYRSGIKAGAHKEILGLPNLDKVIDVDQSPLGRTPRSNPATYTGIFTDIRNLFAQAPEARMRGYKPGRFSFNVKGGRCEACQGDGLIKIEMHFLPDIYVECDVCKGKRYNRETLDILYKGKNISEVLDLTVVQALRFFENIPGIRRKLQTLYDVGLEYIKIGQAATTLSGGEAQRVKLSRELSKKSTGRTLYILDEPTTGLHFADIQKLLDVLNRLVDAGNTVVIIEHNLDVIKSSDHIVDLGPEGGDRGGMIIAQGTPEEVMRVPESYTGLYLKKVLQTAEMQRLSPSYS
ncbi:MAG: excinuclease ABC subunit UvrA [Nitrospirae bacterium CG_4_9_14_3_um_filter_53_35]|nr:MAG: excinuclease ABC subunit A [Nitrospirae bacterium CG2_30_53_67]PJA75385.1 MAG: excinuclease ABC subunit UvrA [Nitrospirae bacterium CG_4_9_14_3_um_filter_53_35]